MTIEDTTPVRAYLDRHTDIKVILSALWTMMVVIFAYVDIFGFFRADVLEAALERRIASTSIVVTQSFLLATLAYILIPALMIPLSLVLRPRANRILTIVVAGVYALTIGISCIGEDWFYYLAGSVIEIIVLLVIVKAAWAWPSAAQ